MASKKTSTKKTQVKNKVSKTETEINDDFLIVGIGASAGGLDAYKGLFTSMPDKPNMAFVIVQHLDPTHESVLTELFRRFTKIPAKEVVDGLVVETNHIYVIPPNHNMAILDGKLQLLDVPVKRGGRRPIDFFLRSLAHDQKERAVGIILSGTGTEGALGIKAIKGEGGLTIVQKPETAKFDGMPRSAIAIGSADLVLPTDKISDQLLKFAKTRNIGQKIVPELEPTTKNLMDKIFIMIRSETGCNFSDYKDNTVIRRIEKRMAIHEIVKLQAYVRILQESPEEIKNLFNDLLIGVTTFFRDKEAFEKLVEKGIPHILKNKTDGDNIRVWVPGCSTGEEAYTLSILFNEAIKKSKLDIRLQIFASDINESAIDFARQGKYPESISADIESKLLSQYFTHENKTYNVKKEIRDQIIFAVQNVLRDPPFSKLDMVSCRNLLIYLNKEAQQKIFKIFNYSLFDDGLLFLGNSESLGESSDLFTTLDRKSNLYLQKNIGVGAKPSFAFNRTEENIMVNKKNAIEQIVKMENLESITKKMLLSTAPASAIIDRNGDSLYFSGDVGKFLHLKEGKAKLALVDMATDDLKNDLRTVISSARTNKKPEYKQGIKALVDGKDEIVRLGAIPVTQIETEAALLMITFQILTGESEKTTKSSSKSKSSKSEVAALQKELESTKEFLRSTIEELETSNEELTSANEELQSANEELQSTNEEMETSKEELQSINEEMITVNGELQEKMSELADSYNDMNNLLSCIEIGTIFLDSKLKIRRFTPSVSPIFNLIPSDIDRPIGDLSNHLENDTVNSDAKKVLKSLVPIKKSVKSDTGKWFQMQIVPFRTSENMIDGVVITFVDISDEKVVQEKLSDVNEQYKKLLNKSKTILYNQDMDLKYLDKINPYLSLDIDSVMGKTDEEILPIKKEAAIISKMKKTVLTSGKLIRQEIDITIAKKKIKYELVCRPVYDSKTAIVGISCISTDITSDK